MKIGVIGMGLMGASLTKAIVAKTPHEVYGYDIDSTVIAKASAQGAHTRALCKDDYAKLDMVIFALCPNTAIAEMNRVCPLLKEGAIVTDICGNKRDIVENMHLLKAQYPSLHFVGTHPMAGKEYGGIDNSTADLYVGAYCVLVPVSDDEYAVQTVKDLYMEIGAKGVEICTAERHDEMIAYTSQLAHVVSSCYVQNAHAVEHRGFSAGSFADLTRVARLNPDMWTELFLQNADKLGCCLDDIIARLIQFRTALGDCDGERLHAILSYGTACKEKADKSTSKTATHNADECIEKHTDNNTEKGV